jgi:P-type E1-E2 ATPase
MKGHVAFKTTSLNEDLGRVEYIVADKTGTITTGELILKAVSIGECVYWSQYKDLGNL